MGECKFNFNIKTKKLALLCRQLLASEDEQNPGSAPVFLKKYYDMVEILENVLEISERNGSKVQMLNVNNDLTEVGYEIIIQM